MLEISRKDFEKIRGNLLGILILHSGDLMNLSDDIHAEHSLAISPEEADGLAKLHEIICHLKNETQGVIEILREDQEKSTRKRKQTLRLVK